MDALRGAAMVAVCVSHSTRLIGSWGASLSAALIVLGFIATPTFLLLSGVVCGYMSRAVPESASEFRWRFIDRGLFLLLVAHFVLWLTHGITLHGLRNSVGNFYMTDAVGIALVVGALIARRVDRKHLLVFGLLLFVGSWLIANSVSPRNDALRVSARLLFGIGDTTEDDEGYIVPVMPYLGLFIVGIAAGVDYARRREQGIGQRQVGLFCLQLGAICMTIAVAVKLAWLAAKPQVPADWSAVAYAVSSPLQKIPPGPVYALAYGGAGIFLAGLICLLSYQGPWRRLVSALAVIGRASLMTFVAQYWVYYLLAEIPGGRDEPWSWLAGLPVSLVVLWLLAYAWDRALCNRFLTLGLRRLALAPVAALPAREGREFP